MKFHFIGHEKFRTVVFATECESVCRRGKVCGSSAEAHATNCHMAGGGMITRAQ